MFFVDKDLLFCTFSYMLANTCDDEAFLVSSFTPRVGLYTRGTSGIERVSNRVAETDESGLCLLCSAERRNW